MKFATLALIAAVAGRQTMHDKLMEEIAKQERQNPSGKGFKFEEDKKEKEEKLLMLQQFEKVNSAKFD